MELMKEKEVEDEPEEKNEPAGDEWSLNWTREVWKLILNLINQNLNIKFKFF